MIDFSNCCTGSTSFAIGSNGEMSYHVINTDCELKSVKSTQNMTDPAP